MTNHPYPKHAIDAVAEVLEPWLEPHLPAQVAAENALQTLWDASRADHPGQVESIPGDTILTTPDNRAVSAQTMQWVVRPADYPAHVIFWSDHDDR